MRRRDPPWSGRSNRTMELTEDGKMLTNYVDYLQYMGTDAWVDCA